MMNQIAISTELHLDTKIKDFRSIYVNRGISAAVAYSAVQTAHNINAKCILASSMSGFTARIVSKFKPDAQISDYLRMRLSCAKCSFTGAASVQISQSVIYEGTFG